MFVLDSITVGYLRRRIDTPQHRPCARVVRSARCLFFCKWSREFSLSERLQVYKLSSVGGRLIRHEYGRLVE